MWYKLRYPSQGELVKKTSMEVLQIIIEIFNLGGFKFNVFSGSRPDIQEFIDKHPDLVEPLEKE